MNLIATVRSFGRALLRRSRMEREMDHEMQFHLEARAADLVAGGLSPADAARRARDEFGDAVRWKEAGRAARGLRLPTKCEPTCDTQSGCSVGGAWHELAVRLALGASRAQTLWAVIRPGACALAAGVGVGVTASFGLRGWMSALLHGVSGGDLAILFSVALFLGAVGVIAAAVAGVRVLRADPAAILRDG
jgi:hypothetical protein